MSGIVVGVDGSDAARLALRFGADEARLRGLQLSVVRVVETATAIWPAFDGIVGRLREEAAQQLAADVVAAAPDLDARTDVATGHPAERLVQESADADLLVVGSRGHGGFAGLLLGSVGQHCLHHATCPVAVVRAVPDPPRGRVAVGVDGSAGSAAALAWALDEAQARDAALEVVHAWPLPFPSVSPPLAVGTVPPSAGDVEAARRAGEDLVDGLVRDLPAGAPAVERTVRPGAASVLLLERARDADVLVVGSRGLGGFAGLLLGSVSQQVAHHAPCPVVVVR